MVKPIDPAEELSVNLKSDIRDWPRDLRVAFIARYDKFWADPDAATNYENFDTERVCRVSNEKEVKVFVEADKFGCCGSFEEDWILDVPSGKTTVRYGFNYGH